MRKCRVLIADDEPLARQAIKLELPENTFEIVAECRDGIETSEKISNLRPDIIFLDIQMPGQTGIEVLASLPPSYEPYLVIVSAYDQYAIAAFAHDASDYLLKPFSSQRFSKSLTKGLRHWENSKAQNYRRRIVVKNGVRIIVVPVEEITFIEAGGDYTSVHTHKQKFLHSESLANLETALDPTQFVRIHRSCIVNVKCIKGLTSHQNGDYTVTLNNGHQLRLSRNYREQLLKAIG
jgi:two-component system, LytTR family, response regulator